MASAADVTIISTALAPVLSDAMADLVDRARPAVVHVFQRGRGAGTGLIWDAAGAIVTNAHVIGDATSAVIQLHDGRTLEARLQRRSRRLDLALLQIPSGGLTPFEHGTSSALRVGELVFAIGHAWGQRAAVTAGIINGLGQYAERGGRPVEFIRSDVGLAPGNSGGPLLNAAGQVVGLNAMIFGGDLSVAIPIDVVAAWLARPSARTLPQAA